MDKIAFFYELGYEMTKLARAKARGKGAKKKVEFWEDVGKALKAMKGGWTKMPLGGKAGIIGAGLGLGGLGGYGAYQALRRKSRTERLLDRLGLI